MTVSSNSMAAGIRLPFEDESKSCLICSHLNGSIYLIDVVLGEVLDILFGYVESASSRCVVIKAAHDSVLDPDQSMSVAQKIEMATPLELSQRSRILDELRLPFPTQAY